MPYSHDIQVGILYMYYHIDMITHGTAFDKPVGSTGWSSIGPADVYALPLSHVPTPLFVESLLEHVKWEIEMRPIEEFLDLHMKKTLLQDLLFVPFSRRKIFHDISYFK